MLQSVGSQRVGHDLVTEEEQQQSLSCFLFFTYSINSTKPLQLLVLNSLSCTNGVASISLTGP